jgi:hypothetical protein
MEFTLRIGINDFVERGRGVLPSTIFLGYHSKIIILLKNYKTKNCTDSFRNIELLVIISVTFRFKSTEIWM